MSIKRSMVSLLIVPVLLLAVGSARAAEPTKPLPKFFGLFSSEVGAWSEYAVVEVDTGKKSTMRNAIVGREGDSFWYEVVITEPEGRNIVKMFLKGEPKDPENIQRLIMKNGDQPAQEMPREFVMLGRRMATSMFETRSGTHMASKENLKVEEVGRDTVTVPAGTFQVTRNRIVDDAGKVVATYDSSPAVQPLGVVRSETDKVKLELIAAGKDATSQITEQPIMIKTPPGMPEGNPRGGPPGLGGPIAPSTGGYGAPSPPPASGGYGK